MPVPQQGLDLVSIITAGQEFGKKTEEALRQVDLTTGAITSAGQEAAAAARERADIEAGVIRQEAERKLAQEAKAKNIMAIFGTNTEASDAGIRVLADRINRDSEEIRASKADIISKMSVGPTDDLLQWISNQFTLPTDVAIHNVKVSARDADAQRLKDLQFATKEQIAITNAADAGTTAAIAAAQARARALQGVGEAAKWTFDQQRAGLDALNVRNTLNFQQLSTSFNLFQASNAAQQLELQKSAAARDQQRLELQTKVENLRIKALERDQAAVDGFTQQYNAARATMNLPESSWMEFNRLPKEQQDAWQKIMNDPDLANGRLGPNPAESFLRAKGLNVQVPGASGLTMQTLEKAYDKALLNPMFKSLAPEQRIKLFNDEFKKMLDLEASNVPEQGSLLSVAPLASVASIKSLQTSIPELLGKLEPLTKDPTYPTKPADVLAAAEGLVNDGKLDTKAASLQVAAMFKAAAQDAAELKVVKRFAIPGSYFEKYKTIQPVNNAIFGSKMEVDMANPSAVENFLIRRQANKAALTGMTFR